MAAFSRLGFALLYGEVNLEATTAIHTSGTGIAQICIFTVTVMCSAP